MPDSPATELEHRLMLRAFELAERGRGKAEPGARVGCVLVGSGDPGAEAAGESKVIGEGWYETFGGPHAEVNAIAAAEAAGHSVRGATAIVTLEPCAHFGKTPPCAALLIEKGVARVVVAMVDPFGEVDGRGIDQLRAAGIVVVTGIEAVAAKEFYAPWVRRVKTGLPWVIGKWAQTLDGKTATASGDSQWISNAASRRRVHELRAGVDAIVVGVGTAIADDPQLTARDVTVHRVARRVVIDPNGRLPAAARMLHDGGPSITVAVADDRVSVPAGVERLVLPPVFADRPGADGLDLEPLLRHLSTVHGAATVMVEGGAATHAAFIEQQQVDELHVYLAPKIAGDPAALPAVSGSPLAMMEQARRLTLVSCEPLTTDGRSGPQTDLLLIYRAIR